MGLISLCAYSEAFSKNLFSVMANICPRILSNFAARRPHVSVENDPLLNFVDKAEVKLGHQCERISRNCWPNPNGSFRPWLPRK